MVACSGHLRALVWKNYLLKRRAPLSTLCEVLLPLIMAAIYTCIHLVIPIDTRAASSHTAWGSDIQRVGEWRQAAQTLWAQRRKLAVVPQSPDLAPVADAFVAEMTVRYPSLNGSTIGGPWVGGFNTNYSALRSVFIPGFADTITSMRFGSEAELEEYIRGGDYPTSATATPARERIWAAIVFRGGPPHWRYSIRMNASEVPSTRQPYVDTQTKAYRPWDMFKYVWATPAVAGSTPFAGQVFSDGSDIHTRSVPGFMTLQMLVDRYIVNTSLPVTAWSRDDMLGRLGDAYWQVMGPNTSMMWDDLWNPPVDGDYARAEARRNNITRDVAAWSAGELYFPQGIDVVPFPTPSYHDNPIYAVFQFSLPLMFVLTFLLAISNLIRSIVLEKEQRLREALRMVGVTDGALTTSWLIMGQAQMVVVALGACLILGLGKAAIFPRSGPLPLFIVFLLFGTASIAYAAFISTFFKGAKAAAMLGTLVYLCSFFPFYATGTTMSVSPRAAKVATCILPPSAFAQLLSFMLSMEGAEQGIRLGGPGGNATSPIAGFAYADGVTMLAAATIWFGLAAWYADAVLPPSIRGYGTALPWYFPCLPRYWSGACCHHCPSRPRPAAAPVKPLAASSGLVSSPGGPGGMEGTRMPLSDAGTFTHRNKLAEACSGAAAPAVGMSAMGGFLEPPDAHLAAQEASASCITISNLKRMFNTPDGVFTAVNVDALTFYPGVNVLLGANAAGKSTLINMLTGLIPPTSGTIHVLGMDLRHCLEGVHAQLGVCPQQDVLWPELTVVEHLRLFASIKHLGDGGSSDAAVEAIRCALQDSGLAAHANQKAQTLSGGQKRKLCVAIAFMGGSRIVFLDEPTSAMDPVSRRATWDLIRREKQKRVIVLTSHFLDEADVLADRVTMLVSGQVHSVGTPIFLKRAFNVGYLLTITKAGAEPPATTLEDDPSTRGKHATSDAVTSGIDSLVRTHVPDATRAPPTNDGEVCFRVPLASSSAFPALLAALEGVQVVACGAPPQLVPLVEGAINPLVTSSPIGGGEHAAPPVSTGARASPLGMVPVAAPKRRGFITSFGLGLTTMEDVFLKIVQQTTPASTGAQAAATGPEKEPSRLATAAASASKPGVLSTGPTPTDRVAVTMTASASASRGLTVSTTCCGQLFAMAVKRLLYARRDKRGCCMMLLLPVAIIFLGFGLLKLGQGGDMPDMPLQPHFHDGNNGLHRIPAFQFKATDTPSRSVNIDAILAAVHGSGQGEVIPISAEAAHTTPDPLNFTAPQRDGPRNDGWPARGPQLMSAWLMNYKLAQVADGSPEAVNASAALQQQHVAVGAGGLFGAYVFTLNGSLMGGQAVEEAYLPSLVAGSNWSYAGRESLSTFTVSQSPAISAALTYAIMVNTTAPHTPPIYANLMHSALYRLKLAHDAGLLDPNGVAWPSAVAAVLAAGSIHTHAHPLPYTKGEVATSAAMFAFGASAIVLIAFAFLPSYHAAFWGKEKETGAKRQQLMSGASVVAYWTAAVSVDVCTYALPIGFALLSAWVFDITEFARLADDRLPAFVIMLALYGAAVTPFALLLSQAFKRHGSAQIFVLLLSVMAVIMTIATLAMRQISQTCREEAALRFVFRLLPGYSLGNGLVSLAFLSSLPAISAACDAAHGVAVPPSAYSAKYSAYQLEACGWDMIYLGGEAVAYYLLLLAMDSSVGGLVWRLCHAPSRRPPPADVELSPLEDDDVRHERHQLRMLHASLASKSPQDRRAATHPVVLHGLRKVYPPSARRSCHGGRGVCCGCCTRGAATLPADPAAFLPKVAVHDLFFSVSKGEVFGFLGINGAGKSTTLSMLSGDLVPTSGTATLQGLDVVSQQQRLRRLLGYCPQDNPIFDMLTVYEHLVLYGRLRGIQASDLSMQAADLLAKLDLAPFTNKLAGTLSGGNKRKLCLAVALVGHPPVVILDEPSAGVDQVSKRHMWDTIREAATVHGCAVILTSHALDEAEALCSRIGVMVDGRMRCIGSPQHLKTVYGRGYQLQMRLRMPTDAEVADARARLLVVASMPGGSGGADVGAWSALRVLQACAALDVPPPSNVAVPASSRLLPAVSTAVGATAVVGSPAAGSAGATWSADGTAAMTLDEVAMHVAEEVLAAAAIEYVCGNGAPPATRQALGHGTLLERHGRTLRFNLMPLAPPQTHDSSTAPSASFKLSAIFATLEAAKAALGIADYGLGQTTLEQVFNMLASAPAGTVVGSGGSIDGTHGSTGGAGGAVRATARKSTVATMLDRKTPAA